MPMSIHNIHQLLVSSVLLLDGCLTFPSSLSAPTHFSKAAVPSLLGVEKRAVRSEAYLGGMQISGNHFCTACLDYLTCSKGLNTPPTKAGGNKQLINSSEQGHMLLGHWYLS